jgi:ectoine hydroxylase
MKITDYLRRIKWVYSLYNLFHYNKLRHNTAAFRKYNVNKKYFSNISYQELKKLTNGSAVDVSPWLDVQHSATVLPQTPQFKKLDDYTQKALLNWSDDGYVILKGFYSETQIDGMNAEVTRLLKEKKVTLHPTNGKMMFAINKSKKLRDWASPKRLTDIMSLLLGREVMLFQSINFFKGSQQDAHSDSIHMTTFPLGYLIAAWIALEDTTPENGPLFYYPGSHKLEYIMNADFRRVDNPVFFDEHDYTDYEEKVETTIHEKGIEQNKKQFLARKGDVLLWHANLLHGGEPILKPDSTRKSMVLHYYGKDVICFHEITERPALLHQ